MWFGIDEWLQLKNCMETLNKLLLSAFYSLCPLFKFNYFSSVIRKMSNDGFSSPPPKLYVFIAFAFMHLNKVIGQLK